MVKNTLSIIVLILMIMAAVNSCKTESKARFTGAEGEVRLITLDPGHFHAALIQKIMYPQVHPDVFIYAPEGNDLDLHMDRINAFNTRSDDPTKWNSVIYRSDDFFEKMIAENKGNVMMTAGNNLKKTEYIKSALEAGLNVFADKPMAINTQTFEILKQAFEIAEKKGLLLYDVMTERFEITTMLQREFSLLPEVFGVLENGTPDNPAVIKESVHHFFKYVSGAPLIRPPWFYDVEQQGEGIVDVTTHLVDLMQWGCFPEQILDYTKDVNITSARRWSTDMSKEEFAVTTGISEFPQYLMKDVSDGILRVFSNGEINYALKGVHAKIIVIWNYMSPAGADAPAGGDTHYSLMRGSKANLIIRQGGEYGTLPILFIEPVAGVDIAAFENVLNSNIAKIQAKFSGIGLEKLDKEWKVTVPQSYFTGHEAHFGEVTERFLKYLIDGKLPDWEVPNMITKYYTTTKALEIAKGSH